MARAAKFEDLCDRLENAVCLALLGSDEDTRGLIRQIGLSLDEVGGFDALEEAWQAVEPKLPVEWRGAARQAMASAFMGLR